MMFGMGAKLFVYAAYVSLWQGGANTYLMSLMCKAKKGKNYMWPVIMLLFCVHDLFFSVFRTSSLGDTGVVGVCVEVLTFSVIYMILLHFFFEGSAVQNYVYMEALDFFGQGVGVLVSFPIYIYLAQGDLERLSEVDVDPRLSMYILAIYMYVSVIIIAGTVWKVLQKYKGTVFNTICVFLSGLNIVALIFYGWTMVSIVFPIYMVVILFIFRGQNRFDKQMKEQFAYYQSMEKIQKEKEEEIAIIRHDIANHISVLEEMKKEDEGRQILKKIDKNQGRMTGVAVIDCLIREKEHICEEKGIVFTKNIAQLSDVKSEYEMISLLANLLDNAIEATERVIDGKRVELLIEEQQGVLHIEVVNSKDASENPVASGFRTTKKNKRMHGYGSRIIRDIVSKNDGKIVYDNRENEMKIKIWM